jgi:HEAT repeat protein
MPKETLPALDRDVERLLFAGAQVARADGDLEARKQRLAPLAAKAPAIAKIVEQLEKVQKAGSKAASSELLNFAALMAQVRGAQAAPPAAAGELAPLPPAPPIESPLTPTELSSLVGALTNEPPTKNRPSIVRDAVERDTIRDLRVLPFCVAALSDPSVGHVVEHDLLPKLGALVVPELRATLRLEKGRELDAKKLRVLAEIEKEGVKPLLIQAIEKGSPELRKAGIQSLSDLDPVGAEPLALKLLAADRSADVRRAAVDALAEGTSDEALEALYKAFTGSDELRRHAGYSLARLTHPRTTERALALLTPELLSLPNLKLPKADTPSKKKANEKVEKEHQARIDFLCAVLDLLASRKDKLDTAEKVLSVFHDHKIKEVKNAAARALLKSGYDKAFDELAPSVYDADWETRDEFVAGILEHDPSHAFERLGRFLDPASFKGKNHVSFAEHILGTLEGQTDDDDDEEPDDEAAAEAEEEKAEARPPSFLKTDPRWTEAAIKLLDHKELSSAALDVLAKVKSDRVRDVAITLASGKPRNDQAWRLLQVLKVYKDPRVPALLLRFLDLLNGYWGRRTVFQVLREYDDAALLPALKAWGASKKRLEKRDKDALEETVTFLERDRATSARV